MCLPGKQRGLRHSRPKGWENGGGKDILRIEKPQKLEAVLHFQGCIRSSHSWNVRCTEEEALC